MKVGSYIYTNSYAPADTNQLWVKPMSNGEAILYIFVDGKWTPTGGVGESAYEAAVKAGFNGSKQEWLDSLALKYSDLTAEQKADLVKDAVSAAERAAQAVENIENTINNIDISSTDGAITALAAKQGLLENELDALGPKIGEPQTVPVTDTGKYIKIDNGVGNEMSLTPVSAEAGWHYSIVDVNEGDAIIVNGTGAWGPRLWGFIDSNNVILAVADRPITATNLKIVAPANAAKAIINDNSGSTSYIVRESQKTVLLKDDVVNNLTTNSGVRPVSAAQATVLNEKVEKASIKDKNGVHYNNPLMLDGKISGRYARVVVDANNKILESTDLNGNKTLWVNVRVIGELSGKTIDDIKEITDNFEEAQYAEWMQLTLDSTKTKIVEGIRKNGAKYIARLESPTITSILRNVRSSQLSLARLGEDMNAANQSIARRCLEGRLLVFEDDFDSFDDNVWTKHIQYDYRHQTWISTESSVTVEDSCLVLTSRKAPSGSQYVWETGIVTTQGKFALRAGRIEARIKIDKAPGQNNAFWTFGNYYNWSSGFEIDVIETANAEGNPTINYWWRKNGAFKNYGGKAYPLTLNEWHIYSVEWDTKYLYFYYDYILVKKVDLTSLGAELLPHQIPQQILFQQNFNYDFVDYGQAEDREYKMLVDWVRIYAETNVPEILSGEIKSIPTITGIEGEYSIENPLHLSVGDKYCIPILFVPRYAINQAGLSAESSDISVATVDNMRVSAEAQGECLITVTFNNFNYQFKIIVE